MAADAEVRGGKPVATSDSEVCQCCVASDMQQAVISVPIMLVCDLPERCCCVSACIAMEYMFSYV